MGKHFGGRQRLQQFHNQLSPSRRGGSSLPQGPRGNLSRDGVEDHPCTQQQCDECNLFLPHRAADWKQGGEGGGSVVHTTQCVPPSKLQWCFPTAGTLGNLAPNIGHTPAQMHQPVGPLKQCYVLLWITCVPSGSSRSRKASQLETLNKTMIRGKIQRWPTWPCVQCVGG